MFSSLNSVRIILVEPAGARNIGSVARVMKNMGLLHLTLVNPQCDHLEESAQHMAVHAKELLEAAQVVQTIPDGLAGCRRAIATLGRPYADAAIPEHPRAALPWLVEDNLEPNSTALIFGPEDRGLSNDELSHAHRFITIPANPVYPSLNLAQAVAICCYELHETASKPHPDNFQLPTSTSQTQNISYGNATRTKLKTQNFPPPAPINELEGFYQHLESLLLHIGYLQPHTASSRMKKFRRLFNRAMPSSDEVTMLRGILSQMQWAARTRSQNSEKES